MSLLDKEPVKRAEKSLKEFDQKMSVIALDTSARTASEAAASLGCEVGAIVKSLLFKTEKTFTLFLVAGDKRASLNKIKNNLSIKNISMASANDVKDITGYTIGGVSPIGHINDLNIIIDRTLERFQIVYAAAGHPNSIFKIDISKLKDLTKGRVEDITE